MVNSSFFIRFGAAFFILHSSFFILNFLPVDDVLLVIGD